jgi:hypothetical protein
MNEFSFRFRVDVAPGRAVSSNAQVLALLETSEGQQVELVGLRDQPISKNVRLALQAHGWVTPEAAENAGKRLADVFLLTLVRSKVGVESWARRGGGGVFRAGLGMLEEETGERVLNDSAGLAVYETNPLPRFASFNMRATIAAPAESFVQSFRSLATTEIELTERERVAIDVFNASFFEPAADTRLLTLVMAIEALLELALRPSDAVALVNSLIAQVRASPLPEPERDSLIGALRWLRRESIRRAGRRLAQQRLGEAVYAGQSAPDFFEHCYHLRSELVHGGDIRKAREASASAVGELERFVSDLLMWRFVVSTASDQHGG